MSPQMPPIVQMPSPNYTPTPIRHDLIIVHRTEGGYSGARTWLCDPRANASAHLLMRQDGSEWTQMVPLNYKAWAQCAFNGAGISIEVEGFSAQGMTTVTMEAVAKGIGWLCREYGIPPIWAKNGQGRGICQHHDLGRAGGGHVDCFPVGAPEWLHLVDMAKAAFDAFGPTALPPWALHGLPQDHEISPPMDSSPMASHGGDPRSELNDIHSHPTVNGYPSGSVADLQWRLNRAGALPSLIVDGWFGPRTHDALAHFQGALGLFVDGLAGPKTWAALRAVTEGKGNGKA